MIPKIIHYVWSGADYPDYIKHNIETWKKYAPDFEIVQWNENNWNPNYNTFSKYFYDMNKWGFVSDVVRLDVLERFGGIYLDADVELTQPIDQFLEYDLVMGMHFTNALGTAFIASVPHQEDIRELLDYYNNISLSNLNDSNLDVVNNGIFTRYFLEKHSDFQLINKPQLLDGNIGIFPKQTFFLQHLFKKKNFAIHQVTGSWQKVDKSSRFKNYKKKVGQFILGKTLYSWYSNHQQMKLNSLYDLYLQRGKR